jgi:[ribosomal protein S18]-alanine N-acetyltransferase
MRSMPSDSPFQPESMHFSDLDEVVAIENLSFAVPWTRNMFLQEMSNESARPIVFRDGDMVVGYFCFWHVVDEAHLLNIAVHPERRNLGLGTLMMDYLERMCRESGMRTILLDVARRNTPARKLYRKCGFHTIGFRKNYYAEVQDDALVMEKLLIIREDDQNVPETDQMP